MKMSRRNTLRILSGSGLAAQAAFRADAQPVTPGCLAGPSVDPRQPHINLICHGMMLFWYPLPADNSSYPDYFNILIPKAPYNSNTGRYEHIISLSEHRGAYMNRLGSPGQYQLVWGNWQTFKRSISKFYPTTGTHPLNTDRVLLYSSNYRLTPRTDTDNVWYTIRVPYPTYVFPYRPYSFSSPAYVQTGTTAMDFGVNPNTMPGVQVFYYEGVSGQVYLDDVLNGTSTAMGPNFTSAGPNHVNIHLYSQPALNSDKSSSHITAFNNMVSYKPPASSGAPPPALDLMPYSAPAMLADCSWPINNWPGAPGTSDFDPLDKLDLSEIFDGPALSTSTGMMITADPVECLQGWGT